MTDCSENPNDASNHCQWWTQWLWWTQSVNQPQEKPSQGPRHLGMASVSSDPEEELLSFFLLFLPFFFSLQPTPLAWQPVQVKPLAPISKVASTLPTLPRKSNCKYILFYNLLLTIFEGLKNKAWVLWHFNWIFNESLADLDLWCFFSFLLLACFLKSLQRLADYQLIMILNWHQSPTTLIGKCQTSALSKCDSSGTNSDDENWCQNCMIFLVFKTVCPPNPSRCTDLI